MNRFLFSCAALLLACTPLLHAQTALERDPGYVDLESFASWFDEMPTVEVNIKGALLRMAAAASRNEDPTLAAMLGKLQAIQVRTFRYKPGQRERLVSRSNGLGKTLEARGWDTIVRVRDEEDVDMYLQTRGDKVMGMMVTVIDPSEQEVVFINIVGEIDPEEVGRLGSRFDLKGLNRTANRR